MITNSLEIHKVNFVSKYHLICQLFFLNVPGKATILVARPMVLIHMGKSQRVHSLQVLGRGEIDRHLQVTLGGLRRGRRW
jgi:hypothetical protein